MAQKPTILSEPFKKALTHSTRALAEAPELEVAFGSDGPKVEGNKLILPHPPRDLAPKQAQQIRGIADRMALRIAHHDEAIHARATTRARKPSTRSRKHAWKPSAPRRWRACARTCRRPMSAT